MAVFAMAHHEMKQYVPTSLTSLWPGSHDCINPSTIFNGSPKIGEKVIAIAWYRLSGRRANKGPTVDNIEPWGLVAGFTSTSRLISLQQQKQGQAIWLVPNI